MSSITADFESYLIETPSIDFKHPSVIQFFSQISTSHSKSEQAKAIYLLVRDGFLYDPYHLDLNSSALKASAVTSKNRAWCVEKAILACAGFRLFGIPARLGFGIVKNHLDSDKLQTYLKKSEIVFHGFVEVFLDDQWTKCTPAFDKRICALNKVEPLNWNGTEDTLFQAFKGEERYMEYVHFYGSFADVPSQLMHQEMKKHYPHLFSEPIDTKAFSFRFDPHLH